jgi:porin
MTPEPSMHPTARTAFALLATACIAPLATANIPWLDRDRLLGDWAGIRTEAEAGGIELDATAILDFGFVLDGGLDRRGEDVRALDLNLTMDLGWLGLGENLTLFADMYSISRGTIDGAVGTAQGLSNIETGASIDQLAEIWLQWILLDDRLRVKVGKIEANSEFAAVDAAGEFLNPSAGFSPTIAGFPTFPDPSFGVVLAGRLSDRLTLTAGLFDGAAGVDGVPTGRRGPKTLFDDEKSDDLFLMAEAGLDWSAGDAARPGRATLGLWHHTGDWARFDGGTEDGTTGFIATVQQQVWSPSDAAEETGGLNVFGQYGWADGDVSAVEHHLAAGLWLEGTFPGREADGAGLYATLAALSSDSGADSDEWIIEGTYRLHLLNWVSVKPSLQYVFNPGGDSSVDDALVAIIRVEVGF